MHGCLEYCSSFPFENYLHKLRRMIRSGKRPLIEVARRLEEFQSLRKCAVETHTSPSLKRPNNAFAISSCSFVEVLSRSSNGLFKCHQYCRGKDLFSSPLNSSIIGSYVFPSNSYSVVHYSESVFTSAVKCIMIPQKTSTTFLKLLHSFD